MRIDSNEEPIKVGDLVAYNWSGKVVPGRVVGITDKQIYIEYLGSSDYAGLFHISKVISGRSILRLNSFYKYIDPQDIAKERLKE